MADLAGKAVLEEIAQRCLDLVKAHTRRTDLYVEAGSDGFIHMPCPLVERHEYDKGPRPAAWAQTSKDGPRLGCHKCTKTDQLDPEQYTQEVLAAIGWEGDGIARPRFVDETLRWHDFLSYDGAWIIRHSKKRPMRGGGHDYWTYSIRAANAPEGVLDPGFRPFRKGEFQAFLAESYPELSKTHHLVRWYEQERFDGIDLCRVLITEGEKDAQTFNRLAASCGHVGTIATTLYTPGPTALATHQQALVANRPVMVMMDAGGAGSRHAANWTAALWGKPSEVRVFPSDAFGTVTIERGRGKGTEKPADFTEWVERLSAGGSTPAEIFAQWQALAGQTAPLAEPLIKPKAWLDATRKTKDGGVNSTNIYNGAVVWRKHPELEGRLWTNGCTGEIEIHEPPWMDPGATQTGAHAIANACAIWLDEAYEITISPKALEDALPHCAPAFNPHAELLAEVWDGKARLDELFTTYLPLNASSAQAVALARVFMADLVHKLQGKLVAQRVLIAIGTKLDLDVARALVGDAGVRHKGRINNVLHLCAMGAAVVQTDMEAVAQRFTAPHNVPILFGYYAQHPRSNPPRRIPTPFFLGLGSPPSAHKIEQDMDERVLMLKLVGDPRLHELSLDAPQLLAEAVARITELDTTPLDHKEDFLTIDEVERAAANFTMVRAMVTFATIDLPLDRTAGDSELRRPLLKIPRIHIHRMQFFNVMRVVLLDGWRTEQEWVRAWFQVLKTFKLAQRLKVTATIAADLKINDRIEKLPYVTQGTYLGKGHLEALESWLNGNSEGDTDQLPRGNAAESLKVTRLRKPVYTIEKNLSRESYTALRACLTRLFIRTHNPATEPKNGQAEGIAKIEVWRSNDVWLAEVNGVAYEPELVAEAIRCAVLIHGGAVMCAPWPDEVREWLAEHDLTEDVEVIALELP